MTPVVVGIDEVGAPCQLPRALILLKRDHVLHRSMKPPERLARQRRMSRSCSIRCRVTSTILLPLATLGCDTPREVSSSRIQLQRPVAQLEVEALAAMPPVEEGEKLQPELVDLSQLDPGLRFDIRYAGVARLVVRPVAHGVVA